VAVERLHGDDTTVPLFAKGKTDTGRCWVYVRDDRPFGGRVPPATLFYYSRNRSGEHPQRHLSNLAGVLQAAGYHKLYEPCRAPGPIAQAACWSHARRKFFVLAGWHLTERLIVPPDITLIPLPAKCPELNPQENVWQFMRDNWLSNRISKSFDDIVNHCCDAWNKLIDQP
jgi:hypothetical protein